MKKALIEGQQRSLEKLESELKNCNRARLAAEAKVVDLRKQINEASKGVDEKALLQHRSSISETEFLSLILIFF
jgi:hypothetical protein